MAQIVIKRFAHISISVLTGVCDPVAQIVIKRFAHISISVLTGVNCVITLKPPSWADKPSHHKLQCQSSSSFEDLLKVCLNVSSKSLVIKLNE